MFIITLIIHIIGVILWIGGLAYVTMVIFPTMNKMDKPIDKVLFFKSAEQSFAPFARIYSIVVGLSGLFMIHLLYRGDMLSVFQGNGIFIIIMFGIWLLWVIMLFGLESIIIKKSLRQLIESPDKLIVDSTFKRMHIFHWIMMVLSFIAIFCGILYRFPVFNS